MPNWREHILREFTPQVARLTLVADPDGLLTEEGVIQGLRERCFELIAFEDPIAFRFAYESKYRSRWDRGELTELVVVLRAEMEDLASLPYDLLQAGRKLSFNLGDLFPNLSYPVVAALDRADLDALYQAQLQYKPDRLGDNGTKDFILLHVFEIAPELIKQPSDLLKVLLRRHFREQRIPVVLDERLIQVLRNNAQFSSWPLDEIVPDRAAFFAFLQERWPIFLDRLSATNTEEISERKPLFGMEFPGPLNLPFDHDDVRVYVDNLFLEGLLRPVPHANANKLSKTWVSPGVQLDPQADRLRRLERLIESVDSSIPPSGARHQEWLTFAHRWAELIVVAYKTNSMSSGGQQTRIQELRQKVDEAFLDWIQRRYAGLHNMPPVPPVMVHHVPRAIARKAGQPGQEKIAMVVIDGLAFDQWIVLRDVLAGQRHRIRFHEGAVLAWLPTITSVSRQALFAGKPPLYFPSSINTTSKESSLWSQFWLDQGLTQAQVFYAKGLGNGSLRQVRESLEHPQLLVAGLVVNKVDKIMHGMELGTAGMHNQVGQWAIEGYMAKLIDLLHELDFSVWLTSDHGNIEAHGCGRPSEGAIADLKGERARIYPDQMLRTKVKEKFPEAIEWPSVGLPENFLPLLAPGRSAFVQEGTRTVAHGGISIEEVIVPLIRIERHPANQSREGNE
ncbi:MAG: BREX-3 system phosphatase PglZ [Deltaproteobacteria bacterium]|nr:BREX-3 system phosphatase PglZ [Deltaproteobacteria bacterium]MBW2020634.1 BREX-3 system phosphatase PglZ [Deltaproteobacteria bacterium]